MGSGAHLKYSLLLVLLLGLGACNTLSYLGHVAGGQARILLGKEPLQALDLASFNVTEQTNLQLVPDVLAFGTAAGLDTAGQYSAYYASDATFTVWVLTAAPVTAPVLHKWKFPIVGDVPYLGFFSQQLAEDEARVLAAQAFEVALRRASAYSTLGWFEDPIYRAQLQAPARQFASTMFHELVHATVYQAGATAWNESVASFTEKLLLSAFETAYPERLPAAADRSAVRRDWRKLQASMQDLREQLLALYRAEPAAYEGKHRVLVSQWSRALTEPSWEVYRGEELAQRPWTVPQILGARLYFTDTEQIAAAWQRFRPGEAPLVRIGAWLDYLQQCAHEKRADTCLRDFPPADSELQGTQ